MYKNINELIDINLSLIAKERNQSIFISDFINEDGKSLFTSSVELLRFAENMEGKGLITIEINQRQRCDLTELGNAIFNTGGWLHYLAIQIEKQKIAERENIERIEFAQVEKRKLMNEYKLSKWQKITFWPIFLFGLLAGMYSIYDWATKDNFVSKDQMEAELSKLQSLILNQNHKKTIAK